MFRPRREPHVVSSPKWTAASRLRGSPASQGPDLERRRGSTPDALVLYVSKRVPFWLSGRIGAAPSRRRGEGCRSSVGGGGEQAGFRLLESRGLWGRWFMARPCAARELGSGAELGATVTRLMPHGTFVCVTSGSKGFNPWGARWPAGTVSAADRPPFGGRRTCPCGGDRTLGAGRSLSMSQAAPNVVYGTRTGDDANV